jgi:two-component SAPR family response regulator
VPAPSSLVDSLRGYTHANSQLERQLRAATIRRLALALEQQRQQLDAQMSEALEVLSVAAADERTGDASADARSGLQAGTPTIVVRCLGSLHVQAGALGIARWRSGKARALFEYLVTHRGRVTPRDTLIEVLWPDPDAAAAGTSLKVAVHALRQALAELGDAEAGVPSIEAHESGYELVAPSIWLDVDEFESSCTLAGRLDAAHRLDEGVPLYEWACELYRGDFLAESLDDWAVFRRESLKDQYLFALARLADVALTRSDYRACIHRCRQLLDLDPYREDTFRTLMVCHARLGQPGRVRRWFELCVQTLRDELDVPPDPVTVRVFEQSISGQNVD